MSIQIIVFVRIFVFQSNWQLIIVKIIGDLNLTMLQWMSNQAHIDALLWDQDASGGLANILEPGSKQPSKFSVPISSTEAAGILVGACALDGTKYNALLYYLCNTGRP